MITLRPNQALDREIQWPSRQRIDSCVVSRAEEDQIRILVTLIRSEGAVTPRSIQFTRNDMCLFAQRNGSVDRSFLQ
ncbi:hypothetical protein BKG57_22160 [Mycobacteroides chelonae]|nr:hypothetical protein BKG57_22160 [Mycobacteroides chelonae]